MSFFKNASILFLLHSLPYIYNGKDNNKSVNIFRKNNYRITYSLSAHYKFYYFASQKLFFTTLKYNYYFLAELFLQNIYHTVSINVYSFARNFHIHFYFSLQVSKTLVTFVADI